MHVIGQKPPPETADMFMYPTTHRFITFHQVKEAFPFLRERAKENQRFTRAQSKVGKVDRQETC